MPSLRDFASVALLVLVGCQADYTLPAGHIVDGWSAANVTPASEGPFWVPPGACTPIGPDIRPIRDASSFGGGIALTPDGDHLWFEAGDDQTGAFVVRRMNLPNGAIDSKRAFGEGAPVGTLGGRLLLIRNLRAETSNVLGVRGLFLRDVQAGTETPIDAPHGMQDVSYVVIRPTGIYWVNDSRVDPNDALATERTIVRHNPATGISTALTEPNLSMSLAVDDKEVFYTVVDTETRLEAVSIDGGRPRVVAHWPAEPEVSFEVRAVDDQRVFYTRTTSAPGGSLGPSDIRAIGKDGRDDVTLAPGANVFMGVAMGPDWLYWADYMQQDTIVRVRRTGGPVERLSLGAPGEIDSIAVDRCNVYWSTSNLFTRVAARSH